MHKVLHHRRIIHKGKGGSFRTSGGALKHNNLRVLKELFNDIKIKSAPKQVHKTFKL